MQYLGCTVDGNSSPMVSSVSYTLDGQAVLPSFHCQRKYIIPYKWIQLQTAFFGWRLWLVKFRAPKPPWPEQSRCQGLQKERGGKRKRSESSSQVLWGTRANLFTRTGSHKHLHEYEQVQAQKRPTIILFNKWSCGLKLKLVRTLFESIQR